LCTIAGGTNAVRDRLKQSFGLGALERTHAACLGICPRLKLALAHALDRAGTNPLKEAHVLLGILDVPESVAARVLQGLGVTLEAGEAALDVAHRPADGGSV
jgi:hypothetical protein